MIFIVTGNLSSGQEGKAASHTWENLLLISICCRKLLSNKNEDAVCETALNIRFVWDTSHTERTKIWLSVPLQYEWR
ncbi:MAG: hypothetical protein GY777_15815 [Candidatus Brocadiaceae bacterium]|nr:hypothetical protein [Candidatus Brocadiaceae bacterium]